MYQWFDCHGVLSLPQPDYVSAFSTTTRGYLVRKEKGAGQRNWCVLDGSTLLCYKQEEVGVGVGVGV